QIRVVLRFARQDPACEREEAYGAEALRLNDGQKRVLEIRASVKVVRGLHDLIAWQALCSGYGERLAQAACLIIGGADGADLSGFDQAGEGAQRFFERHVGVVDMREVDVDIVGLEASEGSLERCID